ncbi:hypothetical protein WDW89_03615 [Deltaproteobacteria bacterium TL4]
MNKIVVLKLVGLKYSGDSIGSDLRIEIEAINHFVGINKKLSKGKSVALNQEIGQFLTNQSSFSLPVHICIIERDPIFNDVGTLQIIIKVDLNASSPQRNTHQIEVEEFGGLFSKHIAVFHVTLEILVLQATRYISGVSHGWLQVRLDDDRSRESLPANLKIEIYHIDHKREYFTILEGPYRGKKASVGFKKDGSSHLSMDNPQTGPVRLIYSISKKTLSFNGKTYLAKDYPSSPWKKGLYDIEIPDFPHPGGRNYPEVHYALSWFRVGHEGDRYIHTGRASLGCITILERDRWDDLYRNLIKARKGDGISIGTLQVVE